MTRVIVILAFLLSFGAGFYTGKHSVRKEVAETGKQSPTRPYRRPGGLLQADLNLTPEQQTQMTEIWAAVSGPGQKSYSEKQRQARKTHDDAILAILSASTIEQIDKIDRDYVNRIEEIEREWRRDYEQALEKTRKMLNPDQLARYNQILDARFEGPDGRGGRGREGGREGGGRGPSSRPTTRSNFGGGFGGPFITPHATTRQSN